MSDTDVITVAEAARRLGMSHGNRAARKKATGRLRAMLIAAREAGNDPFLPGPLERTTIAAVKRACPSLKASKGEQASSIRRVVGDLKELVDDRIDATLGHRLLDMRETIAELRTTVREYALRVAALERKLGILRGPALVNCSGRRE